MRSTSASTTACFSLRTFAFGIFEFHLHKHVITPSKKAFASAKTQRHKNNQDKLLMSSAGITPCGNQLSSERSNNIQDALSKVKHFLLNSLLFSTL